MGQHISYLHISKRPVTQSDKKYCTIFSLNSVIDQIVCIRQILDKN